MSAEGVKLVAETINTMNMAVQRLMSMPPHDPKSKEYHQNVRLAKMLQAAQESMTYPFVALIDEYHTKL